MRNNQNVNISKELGKMVMNLHRRNSKLISSSLSGLHMTEVPTTEEVISQSKILCQDYVYAKLKKKGIIDLTSDKFSPKKRGRHYSDVSREIQYLGTELEKMYPELYKSITKQLSIPLNTEANLRKTFMAIASHLYRNEKITWGRIVALFAIASALAADSIQEGHPEFVSIIIDNFSKITAKHLAPWIVQQGGWVEILRVFRTSKDAPIVWTLSLIGAVVGFGMTLLATLQL